MADTKVLELRDSATCIPVIAVKVEAKANGSRETDLLFRACYSVDEPEYWIIELSNARTHHWADHQSGAGTFDVAFAALKMAWDGFKNGDVVECGFISGREPKPQGSDI